MSAHDSVMVYYSLVRSILECACVMFAALPQYLSDSLHIQRGLNLAGIPALQDRRSAVCPEFIVQLTPDNLVYKLGASRLEYTSASAHYSLRSRDRVRTKTTATNRFGDFVTNKYATDLT